MKNGTISIAALSVAVVLGFIAGNLWKSIDRGEPQSSTQGDRDILYWVAPMDPSYRRDEPGKSPMGMDLVPVYADEAGPDGLDNVSIDPAIVSNLGVRTGAAERGVLSRRIETVGYVDYDETSLHHVHTRVEGWIEKLAVSATGDPVEKGEVLFELFSPTLVNAQEEYLATLGRAGQGFVEASRKRLLALGVTQAEVDRLARERRVRQRTPIIAPSDGVIMHLGVREGMHVTPAMEIMSIARLSQVWVLAEVLERQSAWVKPGQAAVVQLDSIPGRQWLGEVDYVYPELDEKTRTLKVRLRFDNADVALRPNMFAQVTIMGRETGQVVHVPREAVIRGGKSDRVIVSLGSGRFRAQPVEIGIESGKRTEIRRGIRAGDNVVTSGQFLIDSESNIDAALERFQSIGTSEAHPPAADEMDHSKMDHSRMDHDANDDHKAHEQ